MADYKCPGCGRATYSSKFKTCSADGCKLNPREHTNYGSVKVNMVPPSPLPEFLAELEALRAEVAYLKQELASAHTQLEALQRPRISVTPVTQTVTNVTLSNAERQKRYRERKKAAV